MNRWLVVGLFTLLGAAGAWTIGWAPALPPGVVPSPAGAVLAQAPVRMGPGLKAPLPTNRFWSSLLAGAYPMPHYPQPLAVHPADRGFRIAAPRIATDNNGFSAVLPAEGASEDLVLTTSTLGEVQDIRVEAYGDWHVSISLRGASSTLAVTYADGSPFVAATAAGGLGRVHCSDAPNVWFTEGSVLGLTVRGRHYGLFAPQGASWRHEDADFTLSIAAPGYFSVARLPDSRSSTLGLFAKHAHARIVGTTASAEVDEERGLVRTTFTVTTEALEGNSTTLLALYPHQWAHSDAKVDRALAYHTVRGDMPLLEANSFATELRYPGILPTLPPLMSIPKEQQIEWLDDEHLHASGPPRDAYFEGKLLGRLSNQLALWPEKKGEEVLLPIIKQRLTQRFTPRDRDGQLKPDRLEYDARWGALLVRPEAFGNIVEMNDHHLQNGYYLRAAAELASRDPSWARAHLKTVDWIVRDMASPNRSDAEFPYLRCFDAYAGHSWASGFAPYQEGNNLESSSEAMNAWSALILLGVAYDNPKWRKLGIYLYTTELSALEEYWFDVAQRSFPQPSQNAALSLIFGGKGRLETWFSSEPEALFAINWLPIHGGSTYLGRHEPVPKRVYEELVRRRGSEHWKMWPDLIIMYRALGDPNDALKQLQALEPTAIIEPGNSKMALHQWVHAVAKLGNVDLSVQADVPLALTFKRGEQRTHVVYRYPTSPAFEAHFSDGAHLKAETPGFHMDLP